MALALVAVPGVLVAACAGPGRFVNGGFVVTSKGYRVVVPEGWVRVDSKADLALRHASRDAALLVHGTCDGRPPRRSLQVLSRHLRFGLRDVDGVAAAGVTIAGRPAVRSRFTARLDSRRVAAEALTVRGAACVYDLVLVAAPAELDTVRGDFERLAASLDLAGGSP